VDSWLSNSTRQPNGAARSAQVLMSTLLELRGAALKVAQFLSLEEDLLPEGFAQELVRACHGVPSMGAPYARGVVQRELGSIDRHFRSFNPLPFAAASLGQVHEAVTQDGETVAVKIQYPGMSETVRSDLRLLRQAMRFLPQAERYHGLLAEVEERLLEECDYSREAQSLRWFAQRLNVEGVQVPRLFDHLSGQSVLTTERLFGLHLEPWLATHPSQQERDAAGQRLQDVFALCFRKLGRIHGDPNPGNMLFEPGGRLEVLDFGCTRWIPPDYQSLARRLMQVAIDNDDMAASDIYREMGLFTHVDEAQALRLEREALKPFRDWVAIPLRASCFDFGADPGFVARGRACFVAMLRDHALVGIRPEFILVKRTIYGLYRVFDRLGARVRCQAAWVDA
jgi:predicted unusual protein kinase regulating ubiquinone biosynthesis (AarF/ABC1/UbiB family)